MLLIEIVGFGNRNLSAMRSKQGSVCAAAVCHAPIAPQVTYGDGGLKRWNNNRGFIALQNVKIGQLSSAALHINRYHSSLAIRQPPAQQRSIERIGGGTGAGLFRHRHERALGRQVEACLLVEARSHVPAGRNIVPG